MPPAAGMTSSDPSARVRGLLTRCDHPCQYQAVVERSVDLVLILDSSGAVLFVNGAADALLGYAPDELVGRRVLDFVHPDDGSAVTTALRAAWRSPQAAPRLEHRFQHRDGGWRPFESIGRYCADLPGGAGILVSSREITDRQRLESKVTQERRAEAIGLMAGAVVHDFNNLLIVLNSCADALEDEPRKLPATLVTMRTALERASTQTRQLLSFGRPPETPQRGTVDINRAIAELRPIVDLLLGPTVALRIDANAVESRVGLAHGAFDQILINLVTNARDAMPAGGELRVATSNTRAPAPNGRLGLTEPGVHTWLVLEVADAGMGMIEDVRSRIFEPFFTTKPKSRGTGLGLPTILAIVRRAGGHIYVDSSPGHGSTFRILLPVVDRPDA